MYINPKTAINEGWIVFPEWMDDDFKEKCIQPNAIDITLDKAYGLHNTDHFCLSEMSKHMRLANELGTVHRVNENQFPINSGSTDIMSDFFVTIPTGVAAFLIVRSTLNRNGLFITSGLYDSGFSNNIGFVIHNDGPTAFIAPHTRVAQLVFVKSEDSGILYNGTYNQNKGQHWSEIKSPEGTVITHNMVLPTLSDESTDTFVENTDSTVKTKKTK